MALSIEAFIGPSFVLICLSFILYGLVVAQVYFYFTTYRDNLPTRFIVIILCVLESLHTAVCLHMGYTLLVIGLDNPAKLLNVPWSSGAAIYLEVGVFCARVGVAFRSTAFACMEATWFDLANSKWYIRVTTVALSLAVLADLSVTTTFLWALNRSHSLAHTRNTKSVVQKLIKYTLSCGILTAMISITTLILYSVFPTDLHYAGALMLLTKVYANSMLAMLNRREGIKEDAARNDGFSLHLSNLPGDLSARATATKIQVLHTTVTTNDA
ncbi:hypothetical protein BC629DRAFT_1588401 [Irpex lacteus]|nr:hypothetical protein BC629DRAFT_1588401 [Irpex lacteus]